MIFAADEYHLLAGRPIPAAGDYEGYPQHENGIGMARAFTDAFNRPVAGGHGAATDPGGVRHGFFAAVDAAPAEGYRAPRLPTVATGSDLRPVTVVTGAYGAEVLAPLLAAHPRDDLELKPVPNDFFGGNIGVAGLLTGADLSRALDDLPPKRALPGARCVPQRRPVPRWADLG